MNLESSRRVLRLAINEFAPTHIVSMVSGGRDSAASHQAAVDLGLRIDMILHGRTGCGIPETTRYVCAHYGRLGPDFALADAGTAYQDYVLRKGFFGKGISAHGFAYRVLKAQPFRAAISKHIRQRRRHIRVMLINGARKDESENRRKHLPVMRTDPARPNNLWVNLIHHWSAEERDCYLASRQVPINPVAQQLCRSGECMCGTMQSHAERLEASALYPEWGRWLADLEAEARALHGFGWGETFPKPRDHLQPDLFQPMCKDCVA